MKCTRMNVTGVVGRGAPRKTWSCVMKAMGIEEMEQNRSAWKNITGDPTMIKHVIPNLMLKNGLYRTG